MQIYRHALLLVQNETDGLLLLEQAERLAKEMGTRITVGHLSADYRELDYTSDSLTKDRQSREVIDAKAMLSRLVESSSID
ncbi:universal stress protein, partial [Escherichia coli]